MRQKTEKLLLHILNKVCGQNNNIRAAEKKLTD